MTMEKKAVRRARKKKTVSITDSSVSAVQMAEWKKFLEAAYQTLLDRPADESGLNAYIKRLAEGTSRDTILVDLESSPEGRRVALRKRCMDLIYGQS